MKTTSKIWGAFLIGLAIWGLIAFVVIITTTKNKSYMPYSTVDSIRNAEIEKVKADYRKIVPHYAEDRILYNDIQVTVDFMREIKL